MPQEHARYVLMYNEIDYCSRCSCHDANLIQFTCFGEGKPVASEWMDKIGFFVLSVPWFPLDCCVFLFGATCFGELARCLCTVGHSVKGTGQQPAQAPLENGHKTQECPEGTYSKVRGVEGVRTRMCT